MRTIFLGMSLLVALVTSAFADGEFLIDTSGVHGECVPAAAHDGTNFLVVWADKRTSDTSSDIYGARVTRGGTVLDPAGVAITTAAYWQWSPDVCYDETDFLVVWEDGRGGMYSDIYGARVTQQGQVLDPDGIAVSTAWRYQFYPSVAHGRANSLVAWQDPNRVSVFATRVTPSGTVVDSSGFEIAHAEGNVSSVAWDGENFMVVLASCMGIIGVRVTPEAQVLGGFTVSEAGSDPVLAFDGTNSLVLWEDTRGGEDYDIYGARVTMAGEVLDDSGIAVTVAAGDQVHPAVAFDGSNWRVVWQDYRDGDSAHIYGARVSRDGVVSGESPVVIAEGQQRSPDLCRGPDNSVLLVYEGWAGTVGGKTYNAYRVWGKLDPVPAVVEGRPPTVGPVRQPSTVVCGVLLLPSLSETGLCGDGVLLDISGRAVTDLHPGANDVRALAPGIYFVRDAVSGERSAASVRKVIVTR